MSRISSRRRHIAVALIGVILVAAFAALGALQILVLNPLAAVPGKTLEQIRDEMAVQGESLGPGPVVIFVAIGLVLALLVLVLAAPRKDATVRGIASAYLVILAAGSPAYFVASFGAGMALADTFMISGADYSPWANVLYAVSGLAVLGLLVTSVLAYADSVRARRLAVSAG